jgi:TRAP-type C4-dicarboxylate transport system substrate-binding protein
MKSRNLFAALSLCLVATVEAGPAHTFKIATIAPDGSAWMTEFRAAAVEIGKRTEGRVAFKFYPGGVMGNAQSVLRKVRIGQLHGGAFTGGEIAEVYPDSRIYGLPLAFRDQGELDFVRERMDASFNAGLEAAGWVNFGFADGGFAVLMSTEPVQRITDLKRHKAWVPEGDPASYAMIQALGIPPVTLPLTDVMTGLSTGLIGTIGASPLGAVALQWHTKVRYFTEAPFAWLMGVFCIDKKQFDKLSAADQAAMREVLGATFRKLNAQNRIDDARAREALLKQGLKAQRFLPEDLAQLERIAAEENRKLAERGLFDARLHAQLVELTRQYRAGGAKR